MHEARFILSMLRAAEISVTHPPSKWKAMGVKGGYRSVADPKPGTSPPLIPVSTQSYNYWFASIDSILATCYLQN